MENTLRLLLVEDNEDDAILLIHVLGKEGYHPDFLRIQSGDEMEKALEQKEWDLIVCDFRLPSFTAIEALDIYKRRELDIPFILVSGTVGEEIAVNMMKAGAHDYIMKDHIQRLGPAIKRELSEAEIRRQRKIALEELKHAKVRAEQSDKLKSNLLTSLSHEFRTPLNGILGFAHVIESEAIDPVSRKNAQNITSAGERLMKTLDSIIWLAQLDSGLQPKYQQFDITQFLSTVLAPFQFQATRKNISFSIFSEPGLCCSTDQDLLRQAISNLVENALKFTREGSIEINVFVSGTKPDRKLVIAVKDTGIGIMPENFSAIFEAFRQVSEGMGRHFEGSGLGLTITKKITDILGGMLSVESEPQTGSIFTLTIPCLETEKQSSLTDPTSADSVAQHEILHENTKVLLPEILIVEDNELNKDLLLIYLKNTYHSDHAPDAETAIRMVQEKKYQAILMDINLGDGMDGLEATEIIRNINGYDKIPIIAVTGYTLYGDKDRILSRGCSHYLPKPFTKDNLKELLKVAIA